MIYLLDTGVFLQARAAPEKLNRRAQAILSDEGGALYLSAASAWEISTKYASGRLVLPQPPATFISSRLLEWGIQPLDITQRHAFATAELPMHHKDPFDRLLIAQARLEGMVLLTTDRIFEEYDVQIMWCGR